MAIINNNNNPNQTNQANQSSFWTWASSLFGGGTQTPQDPSASYSPYDNVRWQNQYSNFYDGYGASFQQPQQQYIDPSQAQGNSFFSTFYNTLSQFPFLAQFLPEPGSQLGNGGDLSGIFPADPGFGYLPYQPPVNYLPVGANGEVVIDGTTADDTITFAQDQSGIYVTVNGENKGYISPNATKVTVNGMEGNDTIDATAVTLDVLQLNGGAGDDKIFGSQGADTIEGGAGKDELRGNAGDDEIEASGDELGDAKQFNENDQIWGGSGSDHVSTDSYSDKVNDEAGEDIIDGSADA